MTKRAEAVLSWLGDEPARRCVLGRLALDAWRHQAVRSPLSAGPLLAATEQAMTVVGGKKR